MTHCPFKPDAEPDSWQVLLSVYYDVSFKIGEERKSNWVTVWLS